MRKFILGTDWWSDCDDAVAVRILARAAKNKEIDLLGIAINACMEVSVPSLESFLASEGLFDTPIGIDLSATGFYGRISYQHALAKSEYAKRSNSDAENAVKLYRRLLAKADSKVEIAEIGFLQVVSALLLSEGDEISPLSGYELVQKKVERFWVMAGKWDEDGGLEHNFCLNEHTRAAGKEFCELCPVPVTFLGFEIGNTVITGAGLPETDPLKRVLADHGSAAGRFSWDPMLVLLALTGDEAAAGYDTVRGTASVDADTGANHFVPDGAARHAYVVKKQPDGWYAEQINSLL